MSWLFSQALVEAFSVATCSDGEPSAQLNVMPTQHKFWRNDKTMEFSRLSQFGLTCAALTEDRGEALLTWYRAAFRARTLVQPAPEQGLTALGLGSGRKWPASFARFSPDTSSWRTAQCSLLGGLDEFSATWPRWGLMRNGESFLRPTPALHICASASGFWQTPVADDAVERTAGKWNSRGEPKLSAEVMIWPTPTASLGTKGGRVTPSKGREGGTLIEAVSARIFATPPARDWRSGKASQATHARNSRPLSEQTGGLLNPMWVEWLMGWPIGWTELRPLAMDRFHEWQRQHSIFSVNESEAHHERPPNLQRA